MDMETKYVVIKFLKLPNKNMNFYECIPSSWLKLVTNDTNHIYIVYPSKPISEIERLVKRNIYPDSRWSFYPVEIKLATNSYWTAINCLKKLQASSNVPDVSEIQNVLSCSDHNNEDGDLNHEIVNTDNPKQPLKIKRKSKSIDGYQNHYTKKLSEKHPVSKVNLDCISSKKRKISKDQSSEIPSTSLDVINSDDLLNNRIENDNESQDSGGMNVNNDKQIQRKFDLDHNNRTLNSQKQKYGIDKEIQTENYIQDTNCQNNNNSKHNTEKLLKLVESLFKEYCEFQDVCQIILDKLEKYEKNVEHIYTSSEPVYSDEESDVESEQRLNRRSEQDLQSNKSQEPRREPVLETRSRSEPESIPKSVSEIRSGMEPELRPEPELQPRSNRNFKQKTLDSKWTLKYQSLGHNIVELLPNTGVYIHKKYLTQCEKKLYNLKQFACTLLCGIFHKEALKTCSLFGSNRGRRQLNFNYTKPGLDKNAINVLIRYVNIKRPLSATPNINNESILCSLRNKMSRIRSRK